MADKQLTINLALKSGSMQQQIKSINGDIKNLEAGFKNAGAGVSNFEKTSEGLNSKLNLQQSVLEKLKQKLEVYKQEQEKCNQTLDNAVSAYEKQQSKVKSLEQQLESAKAVYGESSNEVKELEGALTKANKALETKRNGVISANNSLNTMNTTINKTEAELKNMSSEIEKTSEELENIDSGNVDKLSNDFSEAKGKATLFGAEMAIVGAGIEKVGDTMADAGKKIVGSMGELVKNGSEYSAELAGIQFLLNGLDSTTQELINTNAQSANSLGFTTKQYTESAVKLANYQKTMGFTTDEINNMSASTIQMVADLAAIEDVPFEDAMSAYQSMLKGNYEAGDRLNVSISANTLANTEYIKSLGKSWNTLSEQEKMTAIYLETQRQATSATGLASQEASEFGMQNHLLTQRVDELRGTIGEKLLPILEPFLAKINEVVGAISNWVEKNPELTTAITGIVTVIGTVLVVFGTLVSTLGMAIIAWGAISVALAGATIPFLAIGAVIAGVIAIIALLGGGIASNFEGIKSAIENLKAKFSESFAQLTPIFDNVWAVMQSTYDTVIQPLFNAVGVLIEGVINFIADCMPGISIAFGLVFDIITTVWNSVGQPIAKFLVEVFSGVVDWFVANLPFLSQVFNQVMDTLSTVWNGIGRPLFDFIKNHIGIVIDFLKPIISGLGAAFEIAFNVIKVAWNILYPVFDILVSIVSKVAEVAGSAMSKFQSVISDAMNAVLTPIQWVIDKVADLFSWLGDASSKIGGFIEKLNPFRNISSRGIDVGVNPIMGSFDTGMMTRGLDNIALSGSYYNANTRASSSATDMIKQVNGIGSNSQSSFLENVTKQFAQEISNIKSENNDNNNAIARALELMSNAIKGLSVDLSKNIVLENNLDVIADVRIDKKSIIKGIVPSLDKSLANYNKLALR